MSEHLRCLQAHGADVDKDGILDAGRMLAGTYFFKNLGRDFLGAPAFQSVARQTVERDTNGDRRFDWQHALLLCLG